jgi:hypothetical protein
MSWRDPPFKLSRLRDIGFELWDPIGVLPPGESWEGHPAADEYDEYLMHAASLTRMGKTVDEVADYLLDIARNWMEMRIAGDQRRRAEETAAAIKAYVDELDDGAARPTDAAPPRQRS